MKKLLLAFLLALAFSPARAGELVMFETEGCPFCAAWNREIGLHYSDSDVAPLLPLKRIDMKSERPKGYEKLADIKVSPTFVVMACGEEVDRILGYRDNATFWDLMDMAAAKAKKREKQGKC